MYVYAYIQLVVLFVKGADEIMYQESTFHVFLLKVGWGGVRFGVFVWFFCFFFNLCNTSRVIRKHGV